MRVSFTRSHTWCPIHILFIHITSHSHVSSTYVSSHSHVSFTHDVSVASFFCMWKDTYGTCSPRCLIHMLSHSHVLLHMINVENMWMSCLICLRTCEWVVSFVSEHVNRSCVGEHMNETRCPRRTCEWDNMWMRQRGEHGEVGGWGRVPFSRNLMSPTPRRKWYLTTGRRFH